MMTIDVRLRALLLTVFLVLMLAGVVQFWHEQKTMVTEPVTADMPLQPSADDGVLKRHFDRAVTQLRTGHYQQAINGFRAVLEQSPAMPEAHINTGFAHIELEQFEQALQSFQTAIDLRPGQVNAYWGLAVSLEGLCDIPGAMGAMRTYLHLAPADDPFQVKANAALWEWEQLKTADNDNQQSMQACLQQRSQQGQR